MLTSALQLPAGTRVFERGWLSSNGILFEGRHGTALVDTGYASHCAQTVALVQNAARSGLDLILNTHLHSDHCGGNAALQRAFPLAMTFIPPGMAEFVRDWDPVALTYAPTGQQCDRFDFDGLLVAGDEIGLADAQWQIHSAPGHDPDSVILFEPVTGTLISADALWEKGFGIVFEELEGIEAFAQVAKTLDLIESLEPKLVIPGHGPVFTSIESAIAAARSRLAGFVADPARHARHAAKVLLKFKLLEVQSLAEQDLYEWATRTQYFDLIHSRFPYPAEMRSWLELLTSELVRSGAARRSGPLILNA